MERAIQTISTLKEANPNARLLYPEIAELLRLSVSSISARVNTAIKQNPGLLTTPQSIDYVPKKGNKRSLAISELEAMLPHLMRKPKPGEKPILVAHQDTLGRESYDSRASQETISNPYYDLEKEKREIEQRERDVKLTLANLQFTGSVLAFLEYPDTLSRIERDPLKIYSENAAGLIPTGWSETDIDDAKRRYIMETFIRLVETFWDTKTNNYQGLKHRIYDRCMTLKDQHKRSVEAVIATACYYFRFEPPECYSIDQSFASVGSSKNGSY